MSEETEEKPPGVSLAIVEGVEALRSDYPVAIGALAMGNELMQAVAQRLFEARHVLDALIQVGGRHLDEVHDLVAAKTMAARDDDDEPDDESEAAP